MGNTTGLNLASGEDDARFPYAGKLLRWEMLGVLKRAK
jgi:hypothetical protein